MATVKKLDDLMFDAGTYEKQTQKEAADDIKETMITDATIQMKLHSCREKLLREEKFRMRIAPAYKPYLGSRCQIMINGTAIVVPCDGSIFEVPESYAAEIQRRMNAIDDMIDKQSKMANYSGNREDVIGGIKF